MNEKFETNFYKRDPRSILVDDLYVGDRGQRRSNFVLLASLPLLLSLLDDSSLRSLVFFLFSLPLDTLRGSPP